MLASDELHGFEFAVDLVDNGQHGEAILSRRYTRVAHGSVV